MASILRVNTLTDASSGNSTPMATINQGTAKAWINFKGTDTVTVRDSFNHSTLTDNGTGNFNNTLATALGSADYSLTATCGRSPNVGGTETPLAYMADDAFVPTTNAYRVYSAGVTTALQNQDRNFNAIFGDLA